MECDPAGGSWAGWLHVETLQSPGEDFLSHITEGSYMEQEALGLGVREASSVQLRL